MILKRKETTIRNRSTARYRHILVTYFTTGSFVVGGEDTQSIPFTKHHVHCMGMWLSNRLHHLWCEEGQCYFVSEECACNFCGCAGMEKYHLSRCEWANCGKLQVNRDNIRQIVKVLHTCNWPT